MRCEKCGKEITYIDLDLFDHEGYDEFYHFPFTEEEQNAVIIDTNENWTGYELDKEEMIETIECPECHQFPFKEKEIQVLSNN